MSLLANEDSNGVDRLLDDDLSPCLRSTKDQEKAKYIL